MEYRFLTAADLSALCRAFNLAFADYYVEMQLTEEALRQTIEREAINLSLSVGAFVDTPTGSTMAGFLLNGIDTWHSKQTAYDGGTGVIPEFRGQGIAGHTFDFALPYLKAAGVEQYLLEVIQENEAAMQVYRKKGFRISRPLECVRLQGPLPHLPIGQHVEIQAMDKPAWDQFKQFWDWKPAWQNSRGSLRRAATGQLILGAFDDDQCVGYLIGYAGGRLAQLAVAPTARRRGIATQLLQALQDQIGSDKTLTIINLDGNDQTTLSFFKALGFSVFVRQYEMILPFTG